MICVRCLHTIPEPPPLKSDYDTAAAYDKDLTHWRFNAGWGTREYYKDKCRCERCPNCWGLRRGGCVCNKGYFRPKLAAFKEE